MKMLEFECKICGLVDSEGAIKNALKKAFPLLRWQEGDCAWDKIHVWGEGRLGEIALIDVYRYEGPGAFKLTVQLRVQGKGVGEKAYLALRRKVLRALRAKMWEPLKPRPV